MVELNENENSIKNEEIEKRIGKFKATFNKYVQNTLADLKNGTKEESVIYHKYPRERVVSLLENPQRNEKPIRNLSNYINLISPNYKRLIEYYSSISLYNYTVVPTNVTLGKNDLEITKKNYYKTIQLCDKYNLKQEAKKCINIAIREGRFCGLCYETKTSFYIKPFNNNYTRITSIEDGCYVFSIDLSYFDGRDYLTERYGNEIKEAYLTYKSTNKHKKYRNRFYEPKNGICIKADTDENSSLPLFIGILPSIYDIEEYSIIEKIKSRNNIFKAVIMKMDVDQYGIPKMDDEMSGTYFEQASDNIPENVGIIMSPFETDSISFTDNSSTERNSITEAENNFWYKTGTSPLVFGSKDAKTEGSLRLSVKPDEEINYSMLQQFERYFNKLLKTKNLQFKILFLKQSIFNTDEVANRYQKAASNGVDGSKLLYAASLGMNPSDIVGFSFLENNILEVGEKMFTRPLISSNTLSGGKVETNSDEGGRPTNSSKDMPLADE